MDSVLPFVVMHGPIRSHSRHQPERLRTYYLKSRAHSPVQHFGSELLPYVPDVARNFQGIDPITTANQAEKEDVGHKSRSELRYRDEARYYHKARYYDDNYGSPNDEGGRSEVIVFVERATSRGTVRSQSSRQYGAQR
jgi:hypothetical protein